MVDIAKDVVVNVEVRVTLEVTSSAQVNCKIQIIENRRDSQFIFAVYGLAFSMEVLQRSIMSVFLCCLCVLLAEKQSNKQSNRQDFHENLLPLYRSTGG